jgi:hypothetical protein
VHCVGAAPPGHVAVQGFVETQWTRQVPVQITMQPAAEVHVTTLPSPTLGPQSLTFVQL